MSYQHDFIKEVIAQQPQDREELLLMLRKKVKAEKQPLPKFAHLLKAYRDLRKEEQVNEQPWLEQLLIKRAIRTLSGVAPIHVMTAPMGCPANCLYCPNEPNMPKSYLSNQPGAMRAILNDFDPYKQVTMRLRALYQNGHSPEKLELIENGGTWTALPRRYRTWFITRCFQAANDFTPEEEEKESTDFVPHEKSRLTIINKLNNQPDHLHKKELQLNGDDDSDLLPELFEQQRINETAKHRMIGITIETRPDWLSDKEIVHLRRIGCTKLELGVQSIDEEVLKWNNRGHGVQAVKEATLRLRDTGFKVAYHIMPGMFKSTPEKDVAMFETLFTDEGFKPDFLKVYPCVVVKEAPLYKLWERGDFVPYDHDTLVETLISIIQTFPRYCRVARLIRDIPAESISGGNKITNLRELVEDELRSRGLQSADIRSREVMGDQPDEHIEQRQMTFDTENGTEYFLSMDGAQSDKLYAFLRLRLPKEDNPVLEHFDELKGAALVRELHTYGKLARISKSGSVQHKGHGRRLMEKAEEIAREQGFKTIAVIAGIGTREYYRKLGYEVEGTYTVKTLDQ